MKVVNMLHRDSQKRYYIENGIYFITTKTFENYPYFDEDILCNLLIDDIYYSHKMKLFEIFGYKINPDHIHLLIQPSNENNYSVIMHNVKRNFSHNANIVLGIHLIENHTNKSDDINNKGDDNYRRFYYKKLWNYETLLKYKNELSKKFPKQHPYQKFKWQKSFHYHVIENMNNLINHIEYIKNQHIKHNLMDNKYCFIDNDLIGKVV